VTPFDVLCGALSVITLVAWAVTGTGNVAIFFSILADFGAVPTLRKSDWGFASWGFPVYVIVVSGAIALLILRPRLRRSAVGHPR
jgi:hypothetical protein